MTPADLQTPTAPVLETATGERLRGGRDTKARMAGRPGDQLKGRVRAVLSERGRHEQIGVVHESRP